ncbi:MAG: hypothetical protein A2015_15875 [Spirochaetes bacterium GWF1_31_7]|nr:MAG: hypothetical protein A2Y30_13250 [Spirochaetes bacterium GWE1_32_154]OHD52250.1 MAG: hypothetical protein A2015_15875 [Spirochaetes bacterium GWF1_31_7]HBD92611.1 hypothetical protein [Spirochaetia bacterium]HBI38391.1 hypothetical protein [Spirochaetia bacterium]
MKQLTLLLLAGIILINSMSCYRNIDELESQYEKDKKVALTDGTDVPQSDAEIVEADSLALAIIFSPGDSINSVTKNVTLPLKGNNDCDISWYSNKPVTISSTGTVRQPDKGAGDEKVQLSATITKGSSRVFKDFNLIVKEGDFPYIQNYITYIINEANEIEVSDFDSNMGNTVIISSMILNRSVEVIGYRAFANAEYITSIQIPSGIKKINNGAFNNCSSMTSISIPDSVTSIGNYAFYGCTELSSITIPQNVTIIGNDAFYACSSLKNIYIKTSVAPSISVNAFDGVSKCTLHIKSGATGFTILPWSDTSKITIVSDL